MILTHHKNLWRTVFLARTRLLMEILGIVCSSTTQSVKSVPRVERENRPCCPTGGEHQHRQGRRTFGSDLVKEPKCLLMLKLLIVRSQPNFGPAFMTTRVKCRTFHQQDLCPLRVGGITFPIYCWPSWCVCMRVHGPNTRAINPSLQSHD